MSLKHVFLLLAVFFAVSNAYFYGRGNNFMGHYGLDVDTPDHLDFDFPMSMYIMARARGQRYAQQGQRYAQQGQRYAQQGQRYAQQGQRYGQYGQRRNNLFRTYAAMEAMDMY